MRCEQSTTRFHPALDDGSDRSPTAEAAARRALLLNRGDVELAGQDRSPPALARRRRGEGIVGQLSLAGEPCRETPWVARAAWPTGLVARSTDNPSPRPTESSRAAGAGPSANRRG